MTVTGEQTLRPDAVGFLDTLVIGLASTSPAYSLAAVLGPIVACRRPRGRRRPHALVAAP